jgi:hypothetical protein
MHHRLKNRTASAFIAVIGALTNTAVTIQVLASWYTFKWEPESEWESSGDKWQLNGLKLIWALLFVYFSSAVSVCAIGFVGILKNKPSYVRFYRDYSIADFAFCSSTLILFTYAAFLGSARAGVCEEFSHHTELMRYMQEMGLNLENCERWLERAVFAVLTVLFVVMIIRLHFLLAVSLYYSHLTKHYQSGPASSASLNSMPSHAMQRIFLLPKSITDPGDLEHVELDVLYAPVSRHSVPKELQDQAIEAWIPRGTATSQSSSHSSSTMTPELRNHHHQRRHYCHHSSRYRCGSPSSQTGTIKLELIPDEGLFPGYVSLVNRDQKIC